MRRVIIFLFLLTIVVPANASVVVTQDVYYTHDGTELEGFLAYDDFSQDTRPGVIVVHEWKGLGDYAKRRAKELAEMGFVAFAIDMYGKGQRAADHEEAAKLSGVYRNDRNLMRSRAKAGLDVILNHPLVSRDRVAAIGYCFGGTTVLEMARAGFPIKAAVSFHGGLSTPLPAEPGAVQAKILVLHGDADPHTSQEELSAFKEEMRQSKADWQLVSFGNAKHSFTVAEATGEVEGIEYNEDADQRSWKMMQILFDEIF